MPGGLAVSTVFATAGFAAVSGASTATAAVFSRVAIPEMLRYGYDRRMAAELHEHGGHVVRSEPGEVPPDRRGASEGHQVDRVARNQMVGDVAGHAEHEVQHAGR